MFHDRLKVTLQLILEACPLNESQLNSLDFFVINRLFIKLFETADKNIVESCQEKIGFILPSTQLDKRKKMFDEKKYMNTYYSLCTYRHNTW